MTKPPAFQFYVRDWATGTKGLTFAEKGVYIDLLTWSWDSGPLPFSLTEILRELKGSDRDLPIIRTVLGRKWKRGSRGYVNRRLEKERRKLRVYRKMQSEKGRKSAQQRLNRGSHNGSHPADSRLQPEGNSAFALAFASTDQDQDQDQEQSAKSADSVLAKLVYQAFAANPGDLKEELKTLAAQAHIPYDAGAIQRTLDSFDAKRRKANGA